MNKALEQKLIGQMEESHTKRQSPKAVLWMELWAKRSKIAAKRARTHAWAGWGFFWEEGVCGCWHKWRGPTRGPRDRGARPKGGRALLSRGLVLRPPAVFLVPKILKYSRKNHTKFAGHLEHFYFRTIFLMHEQFRKQTDNTIFALFILNNRK